MADALLETEPSSNGIARPSLQVRRLPVAGLELLTVPYFVAPDECRALCALIDRDRRPSTLANHNGSGEYRTSETCDLPDVEPVVRRVDEAICALLGFDKELGEPIQGQRYAVGQEFREHTDTFNPGSMDYLIHCGERGQRTWTAMVYLNDVAAGGGTRFKKINKTFQPSAGTLLAWNNLRPDSEPNMLALHQGMKVRAGVKYILTKWFRQRPR